MQELLPLFLHLSGRRVLLVGGGEVAAAKLRQLTAVGADVRVVAPDVCGDIEGSGVPFERRPFEPRDLDNVWLVVAAATPDANRQVAAAAEARHLFVNAVDDPAHASAFLSGVVRRHGVTLAISTSGEAPALTSLLREALDAVLPRDVDVWLDEARRRRSEWRRDGVPINARRPLLLEALNRLYSGSADSTRDEKRSIENAPNEVEPKNGAALRLTQPLDTVPSRPRDLRDGHLVAASQERRLQKGHVSLVGAGPGDPGLLTRRAVARLRNADVVLYDALIDHRILKLARRAQRFFVGKRAGRQALTQQAIHGVMIRAARRGKRVVRLKGGDPFVFGRGGEEALALRAAGVSFDVVPGVTSAVAAPALAGIPVTHRGVSSAFLVVGGHDAEAFVSALGSVAPNTVTIVILMGIGRRVALARGMLDRGWARRTPAAIVMDASKPTQTEWRGTLEELATDRVAIENDGPGTIVVGEVVALSTPFRQAGLVPREPARKEIKHGSR
jgi:uroporphyrin-III C-methyltransferase / precorrin-2 dehydrogenase / sirohydrochlorin ferrochelatase